MATMAKQSENKKYQKDNKPKNVAGRVPPHNIEAEQALLGGLMLRPTALSDIMDTVGVDSFYVGKHRKVFEAMLELFQKNEPIDLVSVTARLRDKDELTQAGGASYITELTNLVPASVNINYYAEIVARKNALRNLIVAGDELTQLGYSESEDIEQIMDDAEKRVFAITGNSGKNARFVGIKEILPEVWENMEKLSTMDGEIRGVPSGFPDLDNKLAGFQKSDLVILAARPSMGKTSLALDIARQATLHHQVPVGFFSLEMSGASLVDRMLSAEAGVDSWKMRTGKALNEEDYQKIQEAMSRLSKAPLYIDDQPGSTILRMRSIARRLKSDHGLGMIIVDYLQLVLPGRNFDSMVNQITEISRNLKGLARELEVPVIALSQLSRAVEARGGKPRLSDLRDSGAIEQDADVVMFIHREKNEEGGGRTNAAEVLIEKHRNGPTGVVPLYFDADRTSFVSIDKADYDGLSTGSQQSEVFGGF